jgi:hypothetical protein
MKVQGPTLNGATVVPIFRISHGHHVRIFSYMVLKRTTTVASSDTVRRIHTTLDKNSANDSKLRECRHTDGRTRTYSKNNYNIFWSYILFAQSSTTFRHTQAGFCLSFTHYHPSKSSAPKSSLQHPIVIENSREWRRHRREIQDLIGTNVRALWIAQLVTEERLWNPKATLQQRPMLFSVSPALTAHRENRDHACIKTNSLQSQLSSKHAPFKNTWVANSTLVLSSGPTVRSPR